MKTEIERTAPAADSQPGNMTVRALAASLIKGSTATSQAEPPKQKVESRKQKLESGGEAAEETAAATETATESSETTPPPEERPETAPTTAETETTETAAAGGAAEDGATTETEAAAGSETETAEAPAKAELPEEVREAIEIAKAQDGGKGKADLLKRVHKLVDERDTQRNGRLKAEEEATQLRSELMEARKAKPETGPGPATGTHPAVAAVRQELSNTDFWLGKLEENPDGGSFPNGKGGQMELDAAAVKKLHRDLSDLRQELVAKKVNLEGAVKAQYQAAYQQHHAAAQQAYPWLKSPEAPEQARAKEILQMMPQLKALPGYEMLIGHFLRGEAAFAAEQKLRAKTNGAPRKAPPAREPTKVSTEAPAGQASSKKPGEKAATEKETEFRKSGRMADLAKSFAARARAGRG